MADVDLRTLPNDEFVLHFGGRPDEVDAYTFSNSLLSLAEAIQEINRQVDPAHSIEIALESIGAGSFRAKIKTRAKSLSGLLKSSAHQLVIGILASIIYTNYLSDDTKIVVTDDSYIVQKGSDRIILPKNAVEGARALPRPDRVQGHIAKTFQVLDNDPSISEFGISPRISASSPTAIIQRDEFALLAAGPAVSLEDESNRFVDERARLVVLKAVFERGSRKWQFVWNGIRISAPIKDMAFFDRLASREYTFAQGDILDATLRVYQHKDEMSGVFINERYEVLEVYDLIKRPRQDKLFC